jgi:hypothetical protein
MAIKKTWKRKKASSSKHSNSHQFVQKNCHFPLQSNQQSTFDHGICTVARKVSEMNLHFTRIQLPGLEISKNQTQAVVQITRHWRRNNPPLGKLILCCCTQEWISLTQNFSSYQSPDCKIYLYVTTYETFALLKRTEDRAIPPHKWRNQ